MKQWASVLAMVLVAAPAHAQSPSAAILVERALDARRAGQDESALHVLRDALALENDPRTLALLALTEQALGSWAPADVHLRLALDSSAHRWIEPRRSVLERALVEGEGRIARISLGALPAGARVEVDGEAVEPIGGGLTLAPGTHTIVVAIAGHHPSTLHEEFAAGRVERALRFEPLPVEPPAEATSTVQEAPAPVAEREPQCPVGQTITASTAGQCCWPAQSWNAEGHRCVGEPECPDGFTAQHGKCEAVEPALPTPLATGGVLALELGYGCFAGAGCFVGELDSRFFSIPQLPADFPGGGSAPGGGPTLCLRVGARPLATLSFGLSAGLLVTTVSRVALPHPSLSETEIRDHESSITDVNNQTSLAPRGSAIFSVTGGVFVRLHTETARRAGEFEAWLDVGFDPLAMTFVLVDGGPAQITSLGLPLALGMAVTASPTFAFELGARTELFFPLDACAPYRVPQGGLAERLDPPMCVGGLGAANEIEATALLTLGLAFLL